MRSVLLTGPMRFRETEIATEPAPGPGEATVRVFAGGICGSDGPFVRGTPARFGGDAHRDGIAPAGSPMHEIAGRIVDPGTSDFRPGDRVVGWATGFDGMAEIVATNADSLATYSDRWSPAEAVLLQPLACVLYAVDRLGDLTGRRCTVLGLGPIGLLFAHVLNEAGAHVDGVDLVDRSEVASAVGLRSVTRSHSAAWAASIEDSDRPDVVLEAVGHQTATLNHAIDAVAPQGTVFYFGVPDEDHYAINMEHMVRKDLTLLAGGTRDRQRTLAVAGGYLQRHPDLIPTILTHAFPISHVAEAFAAATTPATGRHKVVITMAEWHTEP